MKKMCKFAEIRRKDGTTFIVDYKEVSNWSLEDKVVRVWEEEVSYPDAK